MESVKPYDYEVEFIESTGTQLIDTLYCPNPNTAFEADILFIRRDAWPGTIINRFWGAESEGDYSFSANFGNSTAGSLIGEMFNWYGKNYDGTQRWSYNFGNDIFTRSIYEYRNGSITFLGQTIAVEEATHTFNSSFRILTGNSSGAFNRFYVRIYGFRIHEGESMCRDFIPVVKNGEGCLYDKVSGELFENQGTGAFIVGPRTDEPTTCHRVEYLQSTGTQLIDTGIVPDGQTEVYIKLCFTSTTSSVLYMMGTRTGTENSGRFFVAAAKGNKTWRFCINNNDYQPATYPVKAVHTILFNAEADKGLYIDGANVYTFTQINTVALQRPLAIFGLNGYGASHYNGSGKVYECRIKKNGVILRDFIPVVADGVGCLYDKVSGMYFYNQGTGDFLTGPMVREYCSLESLAYYTEKILGITSAKYTKQPNVLIEEEGIFQVKDNSVYPVAHPDLSTQPSILPQRFGNLKMYEVVSRVEALEKYFAPFSKDVCDNAYIIPVVEVLGERNAFTNLTDFAGSVDLVNYSPYVVVASSPDTFFMNQLCLVNGKPALYGTVGSNTFRFMLDGFLRDIPIRLHDADIKSEGLYNMDGHTLALGMDGEAYAIIARWDINPFTSQSHTTAQMDIRCNIKQPYLLKDVPEGVRVVHADVWGQNRLVPCELEKREDGKWVIPHLDFKPEFVTVQYLGEDSGYYYYEDTKKKKTFTFWVKVSTTSSWGIPSGLVVKEIRMRSGDSNMVLFDSEHNSILGNSINVMVKCEVKNFATRGNWPVISLSAGVTDIYIVSGEFLPTILLSPNNSPITMAIEDNISDVRVPLNGEIGSDISYLAYAKASRIYCADSNFYADNPDFLSAIEVNGGDWHSVLYEESGSSSIGAVLNQFNNIVIAQ